MNEAMEAGWRRYFADSVISGDRGEIDAATRAALAAVGRGASETQAKEAGKAEARRYRESLHHAGALGRGPVFAGNASPMPSDSRMPGRASFAASTEDWPALFAPRLLAAPVRWGWQGAETADPPPPVPAPLQLGPKPVWIEPPHPDVGPLHAQRSQATRNLVVRLTLAVVAFLAFGVYQATVASKVAHLGGREATKVYGYLLPAAGILMGFWVLQALGAIRRASASIRAFQQPYLALRAAEKQRHQQALRQWGTAVRQYQAEQNAAQQALARHRSGPLWYPVHPVSEPTRVDVFGGDPHRFGWACLLVMLGTSLLVRGHRLTVLDLTGQEVGGELVRIAAAKGMRTRRTVLDEGSDVDLLAGLSQHDIAESLAYALTERAETGAASGGEQREERALATEVFGQVLACLDQPLTFARLAAALRVLRRGGDVEALAPHEVGRLVDGIGEVDQNEWTGRRLRYWASRLDVLHRLAPAEGRPGPLWSRDDVSLLATPGGRDDRTELIDRLLLQLARQAMRVSGLLGSHLVVAGADRLGASTVAALSEQARAAGIRLVLFLDQPQGDIEKTVGTGGAVCIMKMYNHRDATIAAEFIGKGHKFVVNQVTSQFGRTFTDGGGDSFSANTTAGSNSTRKRMRNERGLSDSRGHAWTGSRNWSAADNIGTSTGRARVYEFITEPQSILGMAPTDFILVDNSGEDRRVLMANCYPGICVMDRVSSVPAGPGRRA